MTIPLTPEQVDELDRFKIIDLINECVHTDMHFDLCGVDRAAERVNLARIQDEDAQAIARARKETP